MDGNGRMSLGTSIETEDGSWTRDELMGERFDCRYPRYSKEARYRAEFGINLGLKKVMEPRYPSLATRPQCNSCSQI